MLGIKRTCSFIALRRVAGSNRRQKNKTVSFSHFITAAVAAVLACAATAPANDHRQSLTNISIPMRDGKTLAANVLLPGARGAYPCILVQTPYNKDRMGHEVGDTGTAEAGRGSEKAWAMFDREHYAYCFVDWRGFFGSKKAMDGVNKRTWKRGQDGFAAAEWCAAQPWCNGKVGTWGGSALGKQQFDTAAEQPPHLVCAVPLIAYQGTRYESYYEGGVALAAHINTLDRLGFGVGTAVRKAALPGLLWDAIRSRTYTPSKIMVPCLLISGWWDNFPGGVIEQYNDLCASGGPAAKQYTRLIMGPWVHTAIDIASQGDLLFPDADGYSTKIALRFFDYFLRGLTNNGYASAPRVHAYQCGERWVTDDSWQKLCGTPKQFGLSPDGVIGGSAAGERTFTYNPLAASPTIGGKNLPPLTNGPRDVSALEKRADVLVYATKIISAPLRMRGDAVLALSVRCDRPDADLHVRLVDRAPDGKAYLVNETIQRLKLRDGKNVRLLKPGEKVDVTLNFSPHAYTWAKGHQLALIITGGNSPRYERNTHTGGDHWSESDAVPAVITILHGLSTSLTLPLVEN